MGSGTLRAALAVALLALPAPARAAGADTTRLSLPGLRAPVEIVTDAWGIPHIYAQNEADLFFAQGYNAARDRLFQLEVWRRQATGTVAEILGPRELRRDIGTRLFLFRGDMRRELEHYHPRGELIVTSFVRGINAYIERTERDPSLLPLEFRLLGITPGRWTPEVVISRHQGLVGNVNQELAVGRAVAAIGPEAVGEIVYFEPGRPTCGWTPPSPRPTWRRTSSGSTTRSAPASTSARGRGRRAPWRPGELPRPRADLPSEAELPRQGEQLGSNNWVVSGALTSSGMPMMVNDPHRAIAAPSLRYWAHLVAPGWNVIGAGEPALPGSPSATTSTAPGG
jgi:penicillin G amidase